MIGTADHRLCKATILLKEPLKTPGPGIESMKKTAFELNKQGPGILDSEWPKCWRLRGDQAGSWGLQVEYAGSWNFRGT